MVDDDGTAYLIHTSYFWQTAGNITIEKLSADYLSSTLQNSGILATGCEAPAMFKRNGIYYALFDTFCGFGPSGTGAQVWTAASPLGPYTYKGNVNRTNGNPIISTSKNPHIAQITTASGPAYLWTRSRKTRGRCGRGSARFRERSSSASPTRRRQQGPLRLVTCTRSRVHSRTARCMAGVGRGRAGYAS